MEFSAVDHAVVQLALNRTKIDVKVLLTTPTYPPFNSGLGNAVRQQAKSLVARGHEVVVVTGGEARAVREDSESGARIEVFAVSGADWAVRPVRGDVNSYTEFLAQGHFDVSVFNAWQTWSTDVPLRMLERISGRKYVYSHGLSTDLFFGFQPLRSVLRWAAWRPYRWRLGTRMRALDGVIFLADRGCDCRFDDLALARRLGIPYQVVPNAISAAAAACLESPPPPRGNRTGLIAVGAYEPMKGHDFVLRAYARSTAKNRVPLRVFGQSFTATTESLRRQANALGIDPGCVTFTDGVSEDALIAESAGAIALLSGSHTECQPLVILDAMATGTPFVARATGCIPFLAGGRTVRTEDEMAREIDTLLGDDAAWEALNSAGMRDARERFGSAVVSDAFAAVVEGWGR